MIPFIDEYDRLPTATHQTMYCAERSGFVHDLHAERLGRATMVLGAGRNRVEDLIEPSAGGVLFVKRGQAVKAGDPLFELRYKDGTTLHAALELVKHACRIEDGPSVSLILETLIELTAADCFFAAATLEGQTKGRPNRYLELPCASVRTR